MVASSMYVHPPEDNDRSWVFGASATNTPTLKAVCQSVDAHFQLSEARLCRYFAESDDQYLIDRHGAHFRGFHAPYAVRPILPHYLVECFFQPFDYFKDAKFEDTIAFDNLIYIRRSTYADTTGLALTYAHELQHVAQHSNTPRLLAANQVLYQNLKKFEPATIASDIPREREANIVSKRVAEAVCGKEAVWGFAEEQVRLMHQAGDHEQEARWIFLRDVPSSTQYDLLAATLPLVERYKNLLDFEINVDQPQWWVGVLEKRKASTKTATKV
jgi:hypothetical protein